MSKPKKTKEVAGVTQTYSHCGYRDQNPRSNFVLSTVVHVNWYAVVLLSTTRQREGQDRVNLEKSLSVRASPCRNVNDWGTVAPFGVPVIPNALTFPCKKEPTGSQRTDFN